LKWRRKAQHRELRTKYREKYSNAMLIYLLLLLAALLKTNFAGLGGSLNEKLSGECPAEF
jgi:hypothetical protein